MPYVVICDLLWSAFRKYLLWYVSFATLCNITTTKLHNICERLSSIDMLSNLLWYTIQQYSTSLLLSSHISVLSTLFICANYVYPPQYFYTFISLLYISFLVQWAIDPKKYEAFLLKKSYQIHLQAYFITTTSCLSILVLLKEWVTSWVSFQLIMLSLFYFSDKLTTSFYPF